VSIPSFQIQSNAKNPDVVPGRVDIAMREVIVSRHWADKIDWLIRHCERSEASQTFWAEDWIASSLRSSQ
jgi:hypothetical protein